MIKTAAQWRASHSAYQPDSGGSLRVGDELPAHGVGAHGGVVTVASAPVATQPSSVGRKAR
jgi:hypothetical protein